MDLIVVGLLVAAVAALAWTRTGRMVGARLWLGFDSMLSWAARQYRFHAEHAFGSQKGDDDERVR